MKKFLILFSTIAFMGCATAIKIEVTKPAEINMSGARTIAVLNVHYSDKGSLDLGEIFNKPLVSALFGDSEKEQVIQDVISYTTSAMTISLLDTGYFTIVSGKELSEYFSQGQEINALSIGAESGAEAIIVPEFTQLRYDEDFITKTESVWDAEQDDYVNIEVPYGRRTAEFIFFYRVIDTETGEIIASKRFWQTKTDEQKVEYIAQITLMGMGKKAEYLGEIKSFNTLFRDGVDEVLSEVVKQLAPYTVIESRYLQKDETDSSEMERADTLVKGAMYEEAYEIFITEWEQYNNPAGGFNAAIMLEALGNADAAANLMKEVASKSGNSDAMKEYQRLLEVLEEQKELEAQMN